MAEKKVLRSLILKYFPMDLYVELMKITMMYDADKQWKFDRIKTLLTENNIPFTSLGSGTNRVAVLIDGYAVKIALDKDGMIDNRREMLYSKTLQPYVVKVYESTRNGLIAVSEYVTIFSLVDFREHRDDMMEILKDISTRYLIGDVGIDSNNYVNWGIRMDGSICILDFAYIYSLQYKFFQCSCKDESFITYDKNYRYLVCPSCNRKYSFGDIRKRISKEKQEMEIGDIRRVSYNLTHSEELVDVIDKFDPEYEKMKKKAAKEAKKKQFQSINKRKSNVDWDYPVEQGFHKN